MGAISVDVFLYGALASYAGQRGEHGYAELRLALDQSSTVRHLLDRLKVPTAERGITFVNGNLSAMPGVQPDLDHVLCDGDRVAFFDLRAMWPFQYRHNAAMIPEMADAISTDTNALLHHSYEGK